MAFKIMGMKHKREKYKSKSIRLTEKKARIEALLFVLYQLSTQGLGFKIPCLTLTTSVSG